MNAYAYCVSLGASTPTRDGRRVPPELTERVAAVELDWVLGREEELELLLHERMHRVEGVELEQHVGVDRADICNLVASGPAQQLIEEPIEEVEPVLVELVRHAHPLELPQRLSWHSIVVHAVASGLVFTRQLALGEVGFVVQHVQRGALGRREGGERAHEEGRAAGRVVRAGAEGEREENACGPRRLHHDCSDPGYWLYFFKREFGQLETIACALDSVTRVDTHTHTHTCVPVWSVGLPVKTSPLLSWPGLGERWRERACEVPNWWAAYIFGVYL